MNAYDWSDRAAGVALSVSTTLVHYGRHDIIRPRLRLALLAWIVRKVLDL